MNYLLFLLFFLFPIFSVAQVNIESQRSAKKGFLTTISLGSQLKKGNNDVFDIGSSLRVDYNTELNHFFILTNYEYGQSNGEDYKDAKFAHLRNTYMFVEGVGNIIKGFGSSWGVEGFTQYQSNDFSDLELRQLLGLGLRYEEKDKSTLKTDVKDVLALGLGGMCEYESLISTEGDGFVFRLTSYISFRNIASKSSSFFLIAYYQPKLFSFSDFRILSELGWEWKIHKNAFIKNALRFNYDSVPPREIQPYDLSNLITLKLDW